MDSIKPGVSERRTELFGKASRLEPTKEPHGGAWWAAPAGLGGESPGELLAAEAFRAPRWEWDIFQMRGDPVTPHGHGLKRLNRASTCLIFLRVKSHRKAEFCWIPFTQVVSTAPTDVYESWHACAIFDWPYLIEDYMGSWQLDFFA